MSSNQTNCLLKDNQGLLWIGTNSGLNRFDGRNVVLYTHSIGDPATIINNDIVALFEDNFNRKWIGTAAGLSIMEGQSSRILNYSKIFIGHDTIDFSSGVTSIQEYNNRIWISTDNEIISTPVDTNYFRKEYALQGEQYFLPYHTYISKKGLWFLTSTGPLYTKDGNIFYSHKNNPEGWRIFDKGWMSTLYNDGDSVFYFTLFKFQGVYEYHMRSNSLDSILLDAPDALDIWITSLNRLNAIELIGTSNSNGIFTINLNDKKAKFLIPSKSNPGSLSSYYANAVLIDEKETVFIATDRGIDYQYLHQPPFKIFNASTTCISNMHVKIVEDDNNNLWFCTPTKGLFLYHPASGKIEQFNLPGKYNKVWSIHYDNNKLLLGTQGGLATFTTDSKIFTSLIDILPATIQDLTDRSTTFIIKDQEGAYWIALYPYGLLKYNFETQQYIHYTSKDPHYKLPKKGTISCGSLDAKGILWIGLSSNDYSKINTHDNSIESFHIETTEDGGIIGDIFSILHDRSGNVWFGTTQSGVFKFNPDSASYTRYDNRNSLSNNSVGHMAMDRQGNLWITTANGVNELNPVTHNSKVYNSADGLPANQFNETPCFLSKDGSIFITSDLYLISFDPGKIQSNPHKPVIVLSSYKKSGQNYPIQQGNDELRFNYSDKMITFDFFGINFIDPAKTQYAYMLEGYDKDWIEGGCDRSFTYNTLPKGKYIFRVKASNIPGEWNVDEAAIKINVKGPLWSNWWFIAGVFCLVTLLTYAVYCYRLGEYKKMHAMRNKISQDLHDDLGSTLSSISINSTLAESYAIHLNSDLSVIVKSIGENARLALENMGDIVWAINPVNESLQNTMDRLEIFARRILDGKQIKLNVQMQAPLDGIKLTMSQQKDLYLLLKESVTNIAKFSKANNCTISSYIENSTLYLKIEDDGIGFEKINNCFSGNGLSNMKERANNLEAKFTLVSNALSGTIITLQFIKSFS